MLNKIFIYFLFSVFCFNGMAVAPIPFSNFKKAAVAWPLWGHQITIANPMAELSARFGQNVAITNGGEYLIVGAYFEDVTTANQGQAYIYNRTGNVWALQATLVNPTTEASSFFGYSVDISDDGLYALVGAFDEDVTNGDQGQVYAFKRTGDTWALESTIPIPVASSNAQFGFSISLSSGAVYAAIGANKEVSGASGAGKVHIFKRTGTTWALEQTIPNETSEGNANFGHSVSISGNGDTVVVGVPFEDIAAANQGIAYVYKRTGSTWALQDYLQNPTNELNSQYGYDVAISRDGTNILVGANLEDVAGIDQGQVYAYTWSGAAYYLSNTIVNPTAESASNFGYSLDLSTDGTTSVIASPYQDGGVGNQGQAYIYKRTGTAWALGTTLVNPDGNNSGLGTEVAISGLADYVIAGGPENTGGFIYIYKK